MDQPPRYVTPVARVNSVQAVVARDAIDLLAHINAYGHYMLRQGVVRDGDGIRDRYAWVCSGSIVDTQTGPLDAHDDRQVLQAYLALLCARYPAGVKVGDGIVHAKRAPISSIASQP